MLLAGGSVRAPVVADVTVKTFTRTEELLAQGTLVQLLTKMRHLVHLQYMVVSKRFTTHVTFVGFLACVCADVYLELLGACEAFLAVFTSVGFFSSVSPHMDH